MADIGDTDIKVDIGVLKTQVLTLSALCNKMDQVIEKLVDQHDRHIAKVYTDMDNRRLETEADIKEIHQRIDTVLDKMETSNKEIMEEFKSLREHIEEHNKKEDGEIKKILEWKWMAAGGIVALAWLISNVNLDMISRMFK
jgi:hypothetical protein